MNETIEIPQFALRPALLGLGKVIPKRAILPVLGHVRVIRDRAGQVFLQGTDLDAFAVYRVPDPTPGPDAADESGQGAGDAGEPDG